MDHTDLLGVEEKKELTPAEKKKLRREMMLKEGISIFECGYCGEETLLHFKECRKCGRPNKFYQERALPSSGGETGESVVTAKQEEETAPEGSTAIAPRAPRGRAVAAAPPS